MQFDSLHELSSTMAVLAIIYIVFSIYLTNKFPKRALGLLGLIILMPYTAALIPEASSFGDTVVLIIAAIAILLLSLRLVLGKAIWHVVMGNIVYDILKTSVRISLSAFSKIGQMLRGGI